MVVLPAEAGADSERCKDDRLGVASMSWLQLCRSGGGEMHSAYTVKHSELAENKVESGVADVTARQSSEITEILS